jgi:uncharacterized repeat protein (TIGR01451 family)
LDVEKTDQRDSVRPGQTVRYEIAVKNTGDEDLKDVEVVDEVPSILHITKISPDPAERDGQRIVWKGIELEEDETKLLFIEAVVSSSAKDGTVIENVVTSKSDDYDLEDSAKDVTIVERAPQIAAKTTTEPIPVPVSAKTGAAGLVGVLSMTLGGAGLMSVLRKTF